MNSTTTRLLKEARTLFPLWCIVMTVGGLRLVQQLWPGGWGGMLGHTNVIEEVTFLAFLIGIPVLATLSLGSEFQYGTFSSLLSQPISRMRIWGEKMSVTIVAVVSAALVLAYGWRPELPQPVFKIIVVGLVAMIASATYWTLVARSTIGGITLNGTTLWVWGGLVGMVQFWHSDWPASMTVTWTAAFATFGYAGVMLWLGMRMLVRFQVTGGIAGGDLITAGPQFMPEAFARLFRSQPSGATLNLIRKEFRLLQPIWPLTLLAVLLWLGLSVFGLLPERGSTKELPHAVAIPIVLAGTLSFLIAILAGSLSLGEERTSGTHSWQLTLPVSARRQWLTKLLVAMSTSMVCAVGLPVLVVVAGGYVRGTPFIYPRDPIAWLFPMSLLTLGSFWCACAVKGTWPAVAWLFPATGAVYFAGWCGNGFGQQLGETTGTLREIVVSQLHLDPDAFLGVSAIVTALLLLVVPASFLAIVQSYRMFRTQPQDSSWGIVRSLLALVLVVLVFSFSVGASGISGTVLPGVSRWNPLYETVIAVERLQSGMANANAAHQSQFTVEDLSKVATLSPLTERWLRDSRITIAPNPVPVEQFYTKRQGATVHLASGLECPIIFTYFARKRLYSGWSRCVPPQP